MEDVDTNTACRVVDFLSGCAYAVEGKVNKVAQSTYLFCPFNMEVSGDLENLQGDVENYL
jgi:cell division inhibitor SepF